MFGDDVLNIITVYNKSLFFKDESYSDVQLDNSYNIVIIEFWTSGTGWSLHIASENCQLFLATGVLVRNKCYISTFFARYYYEQLIIS